MTRTLLLLIINYLLSVLANKFHMTPFMLKHTENYMLENADMASVAGLVNDTSIGGPSKEMLEGLPNQKGKKPKGLASLEKKPKEPEPEDEKTQTEMNNAASLGIIDQKFAQ